MVTVVVIITGSQSGSIVIANGLLFEYSTF